MLAAAGKYTDVRAALPAARRRAPRDPRGWRFEILKRLSRGGKKQSLREYFEQELREGRVLDEYLRREKGRMAEEMRRTARETHAMKANPKSDFKLVGAIPARLFHRWRRQDPDFWRDDANLRSLRRDNADLAACIKV